MKAVDPAQMAAFGERIRSRLAGIAERYMPDGASTHAEIFKLIADL